MRRVKFYPPESRRWGVPNNLQCTWCGNTEAFFIDLKLKHRLSPGPAGGLVVDVNSPATQKVMASVSQNVSRMVDKALMEGREIIGCANCGDGQSVDLQERLLDYCWMRDCPGCDICGEYLAEDVVTDLCGECLVAAEGQITEDDCRSGFCPHFEDGLLDVLAHYGLTLKDLKQRMGF